MSKQIFDKQRDKPSDSPEQHESQTSGKELLTKLRDIGFDSDDEKFATVLGRPVSEVKAWINGTEAADDDVLIKARGIALERQIDID
jgi:hypothetical protein